jgi:hypothetical protein
MNKNSKINKYLPLHKNGFQTGQSASTTSPSVDVNGQPVAENDDSPNLFEDHIKQKENKGQHQ